MTEHDFEGYGGYEYRFEMAALTADVIAYDPDTNMVLLIQRQDDKWSLPGGFIDIENKESAADAAVREFREETGLKLTHGLNLLKVFDAPHRDHRGRVVSFAHWTWIPGASHKSVQAGDDAKDALWYPLEAMLSKNTLAFDHNEILRVFNERVL